MSAKHKPSAALILGDFDKRCPKCYDEGHGGDGCEYCWKHNVELEAVEQAQKALCEQLISGLPEKRREHNLMCPVRYHGFQADQCNCGVTVRNNTIDEVNAHLKRFFNQSEDSHENN